MAPRYCIYLYGRPHMTGLLHAEAVALAWVLNAEFPAAVTIAAQGGAA